MEKHLGLTTIYNKKIFTLPFVNFSLNSAQFQYTHTGTIQYDSSVAPVSLTSLIFPTIPRAIPMGSPCLMTSIKKPRAPSNSNAPSVTQDGLSTTDIPTYQLDDQASIEYDQKFAPNGIIHIPFTHLKIKLQDAIELQAIFLMELINNQSTYIYNKSNPKGTVLQLISIITPSRIYESESAW